MKKLLRKLFPSAAERDDLRAALAESRRQTDHYRAVLPIEVRAKLRAQHRRSDAEAVRLEIVAALCRQQQGMD